MSKFNKVYITTILTLLYTEVKKEGLVLVLFDKKRHIPQIKNRKDNKVKRQSVEM